MNLKELRMLKGLSQNEVANYFSIPLRTYKRLENEDKYINTFKYQEIVSKLSEIDIKKPNKSPLNLKIAIAGIGYVGLSLGMLLCNKNDVTMVDIVKEKVDLINSKKAPFEDNLIKEYLTKKDLKISASLDKESYKNKDIIIIATPTNFDEQKATFDVDSVNDVIETVNEVNPSALVVIKSTVPIGFTEAKRKEYPNLEIVFSPEFLREGKALYDNLYPSRIIIGCSKITKKVKAFACLLENSVNNLTKCIFMSSKEAEASKLFANAYLAMRVAYFNELDSYALANDLEVSNIVKGISLDPRIGDYYNNPSFGYGGYCLPKDSKMLSSSFTSIQNNNLIKAILDSNQTRKEFIAETIISEAMKLSKKDKREVVVGIYKLSMKKDSDNFRNSASLDVMNLLISMGIKVIVFDEKYGISNVDFDEFVLKSDIIIANRVDSRISAYKNKLFTRDLYSRD